MSRGVSRAWRERRSDLPRVGRISRALGVAWPAFGVAWPIGAVNASREPEPEWFQVFGVNVGRIYPPTSVGSPPHGSRSRSQNVPAAPNGEKRTITRLVRGGVAGSSSEKAP